MTLTQNQDVIQQFTPDAANETLADRIGLGCFDGRVDHIDPSPFGDMFELVTELTVVIADEKARSFAKWCRFAQLLGDPGITRRTRDTKAHHAT